MPEMGQNYRFSDIFAKFSDFKSSKVFNFKVVALGSSPSWDNWC